MNTLLGTVVALRYTDVTLRLTRSVRGVVCRVYEAVNEERTVITSHATQKAHPKFSVEKSRLLSIDMQ